MAMTERRGVERRNRAIDEECQERPTVRNERSTYHSDDTHRVCDGWTPSGASSRLPWTR